VKSLTEQKLRELLAGAYQKGWNDCGSAIDTGEREGVVQAIKRHNRLLSEANNELDKIISEV